MNLPDSSATARIRAKEGDTEGAASLLKEASHLLPLETDLEPLLAFADVCHDWGPEGLELAAIDREFHRNMPALTRSL